MANNPNHMDNLRPLDSETAREAQKKGVEKRKQNKTVRETMKFILSQPVEDKKQLSAIEKAGLPVSDKPTYMDFVVASIMLRTAQKGRMDDLLRLMDVVGEARDDSNLATLDKALEILGGVHSVIDEEAD